MLVLAGGPLVEREPCLWVRQPNNHVVFLELPILAPACGASTLGLVSGLASAALLALQIAVEDRALGRRPARPSRAGADRWPCPFNFAPSPPRGERSDRRSRSDRQASSYPRVL